MPRPLSIAVLARAVMPIHGIGGLERSVHDLVRHLAGRGVNVTLIVPPARTLQRHGHDPFSSPHVRVRHVRYLTFPYANRRGTTVIDRSTAYLLYGLRAGRLARAMARDRQIDLVHSFGASALGAAIGRLDVPLVMNPQGLEEFGATRGALPPFKRLGYAPLRWAVRRVARRANRIIATDVSLEPTVDLHLRPRAGQMQTIPNGIDLAGARAVAGPAEGLLIRQRHGIQPGELLFLSVGRLEFNKGFDLMPPALARASAPGSTLSATGWRWVLLGSGPYRAEIERHVAAHQLEPHVILAGRASERDLHSWYEAASVFVHPTRYEGSSLVTLEAMAHGRPIIATIAGGLPDKVHPHVNGWLVEPEDPDALAAAFVDAASDATRLLTMGTRSREIVERHFAWPVLVDRYMELYAELIDDPYN
jgi:glycosyltransferase involved in cell wall biosynthesis